MLSAESILKWFGIGGEVGFDLRSYDTFQDFCQKREVGNGPKVIHDVGAESKFFKDGGYNSKFEGLWY